MKKACRRTASRYVAAKDVTKLIDAYRNARALRGEPTTPFELFSAINTDVMFRKTAIRIAQAQCKHAPGGYHYLFAGNLRQPAGSWAPAMSLEVGFVFGNHDASFCGSGPEADKLSKEMQDAWVSFARTGNPSCKSLGEWPQYCDGRSSMIFDRNSRIEKAAYEEERKIWETLDELKYSNMP